MKKTAIFFMMTVLFQGLAFAQLKLGVKAGVNISNLSGYTSQDLINDVKGANSYQFGILAKVKLGNFFSLQPEVLLSMKGAELTNDQSNAALNTLSTLMGETIPNSLHLKTTYLEVPLNIQAGIGLGSLARIYGQVSPYLSYLISDNVDGAEDFYAAYKNFLSNYDGAQPLNSFDYGIGLGAGVEVLFLQLSVKYDFSLNEFKEVAGTILDDVNPLFSSLKHRNLSISLAFLF